MGMCADSALPGLLGVESHGSLQVGVAFAQPAGKDYGLVCTLKYIGEDTCCTCHCSFAHHVQTLDPLP